MAAVAHPQSLKCAPSSQSSETKPPAAIWVAPGAGISTSTGVKVMNKILISPWRRKPDHNPRYSVYNGREHLGLIFEHKGIFSAVDANGRLITASTSVQIAANVLTARAS
jgi:hypothetical protein